MLTAAGGRRQRAELRRQRLQLSRHLSLADGLPVIIHSTYGGLSPGDLDATKVTNELCHEPTLGWPALIQTAMLHGATLKRVVFSVRFERMPVEQIACNLLFSMEINARSGVKAKLMPSS